MRLCFATKKVFYDLVILKLIVTQNQIVIDYETVNTGERGILQNAIINCEKNTGVKLKELIGDGGFGDEPNYDFLEKNGTEAYVKHNRYYKEKSKKRHQEKVRATAFRKKSGEDALLCPNGKELKLIKEHDELLRDDYIQKVKSYKADSNDCAICPYKGMCTDSDARTVEVRERYDELRKKA